MKVLVSSLLFVAILHYSYCGPLRLQKRAAFYIANETACVVDNTVYSNGDPIPTDDPCEACKCRPPGFACVLKECEVKPGCRAVRRTGHCCPDYICGCEHNGRMYRDGDEIRDSQNPCYTCHCQGSSIACAFIDCFFRVDCAPEYVTGECCPHYTNCTAPKSSLEGSNPYLKDKESSIDTTIVPSSVIVPGVSYVEDTTEPQIIDTTVIEVFEVETKQPEILQFNPEAVSIIDRITSEESSETEESEEESKEITSTLSGTPDVETVSDSNVELKVDGELVDIQHSTEQAVTHHEIFTPETISDVTEQEKPEHSTEVSLEPVAPLVVANVDVEPEEPSNNLESESPSSDYGKSLKFDDTKEPKSETAPKEPEGDSKEQKEETEPKEQSENNSTEHKSQTEESGSEIKQQESSTQRSQNLLHIKENSDETITTEKVQEEIVSPTSVKVSTIDDKKVSSDSTEKISLYVEKDSFKTESVETVATVADTKELTTASIADKSDLSVASTIAASLFNFNSDKLGDQESTILPDVTSIKIDSTVKAEDVELKLSSHSEVESSSSQAEIALHTTFSPVDEKATTIKID